MPYAWMLGVSLLLTVFPLRASEARNIGHRVGAGPKEFHKDLPENSLSALRAALVGRDEQPITPIQYRSNFDYMEFDVQETKDNHLVLFHDGDLVRMLPPNEKNAEAIKNILKEINKSASPTLEGKKYKDLSISDLTLGQLRTLSFGDGEGTETVPTLEEFLNSCRKYGLEKPMAVEIKYIYSDVGRAELIRLVKEFRDDHVGRWDLVKTRKYDLAENGISFIAFPKNFKKSFGKKRSEKRRMWCQKFHEAGFKKIYGTIFHSKNLCK